MIGLQCWLTAKLSLDRAKKLRNQITHGFVAISVIHDRREHDVDGIGHNDTAAREHVDYWLRAAGVIPSTLRIKDRYGLRWTGRVEDPAHRSASPS